MKKSLILKLLIVLVGINLFLDLWQIARVGFSKIALSDYAVIVPELILYLLTLTVSIYLLKKGVEAYEGKEKRIVVGLVIINLIFLILFGTGFLQKYFELQSLISNY